MADEITYSASLTIKKGNISIERKPETILIDWTDGEYIQGTQNIGSTYETLQSALSANLPSTGIFWIRNTGLESLYISFNAGTSEMLVVGSGEYFPMRLTPTFDLNNLTVKAFTTSTTIEYIVHSN